MFRGISIDQFQCFVAAADDDGGTVLQRFGGDSLPGQYSQLLLQGFLHPAGESFRKGDQHHLAVLAVFCLREQIGRHKSRLGAFIGTDKDFGRPGRHIDGDAAAAHQLLGGGYVLVARAEDFVHSRNCFGTVGHGGHRLSSSHLEDTSDAHQLGGI